MAIATVKLSRAAVFKSGFGCPYSTIIWSDTRSTATMSAMKPRKRPRLSNFNSKGVLGVCASAMSRAILPSSVLMPVLVTRPNPLPEDTVVPI